MHSDTRCRSFPLPLSVLQEPRVVRQTEGGVHFGDERHRKATLQLCANHSDGHAGRGTDDLEADLQVDTGKVRVLQGAQELECEYCRLTLLGERIIPLGFLL